MGQAPTSHTVLNYRSSRYPPSNQSEPPSSSLSTPLTAWTTPNPTDVAQAYILLRHSVLIHRRICRITVPVPCPGDESITYRFLPLPCLGHDVCRIPEVHSIITLYLPMLGSGPEEGGRFRTQLIQLHMSGVILRMYGLVKLIRPLAATHPNQRVLHTGAARH